MNLKAWKCNNCNIIFLSEYGKCPRCKLKMSYTKVESDKNGEKCWKDIEDERKKV
jgi:hypothetical protein